MLFAKHVSMNVISHMSWQQTPIVLGLTATSANPCGLYVWASHKKFAIYMKSADVAVLALARIISQGSWYANTLPRNA